MNQSRKRMRSDDADFGVQMKYFVSQQIIEKNDKNLMNGIYEKTLNMIFAGAKIQNQNHQNQSNNNNNESILDTIDDKPHEPQGCMNCWKDVETPASVICKNCNLKTCASCHTSCVGCSSNLCSNCVNIFGCSLSENPICEECKRFVD